jgi:UDP-N-acetylglucosamine:LPS N-acetylglucosamine transferase
VDLPARDDLTGRTVTDDEVRPDRADRLRLLLVGSSGGHLAQLTALEPWSRSHDRHWVCFDTPDAVSILASEQVTWAHHPTTRNLPNLARNLVLAWKVLRRERPDVVISTGAGVAVPFFVLGRLVGVPTLFLEVYDRLDTPTLTGRLCRPFATRMLVQWEEQRSLYRDAEVVGCVL